VRGRLLDRVMFDSHEFTTQDPLLAAGIVSGCYSRARVGAESLMLRGLKEKADPESSNVNPGR